MRGTTAMRIPVWPLIRRAAKVGSRLDGELVLEQQYPEHPRGHDALEDRHRSGKSADRRSSASSKKNSNHSTAQASQQTPRYIVAALTCAVANVQTPAGFAVIATNRQYHPNA